MDKDIHRIFSAMLAPTSRLSPDPRLIRLRALPGADAPAVLEELTERCLLEHFEGREATCEDFRFDATVLSTSANLELAPLLGIPIGLELVQDNADARRWFGLVTEVGALGSDGGLARYRLRIEPFTALLRLRRNALIFPAQDIRTVVEQVLADYPLASLRWEASCPLPVRDIITQYRETDARFVYRLLAEAGLCWHFEHGGEGAPAGHVLVVRDDQSPVADTGEVRFHRIDATEARDAINLFGARSQLAPSRYATASWQTGQVKAVAASSEAEPGAQPEREVFAMPRAGCLATQEEAQRLADVRLTALRLPRRTYGGSGSCRKLRPMATFALSQHYMQGRYLPLVIEHVAHNNLGAGIVVLLAHASQALEHGSYRNRFVAVSAGTPAAPVPPPRPVVHGPQTARVVGLPDAAVTPNREHQVRIQFPWQRGTAPWPGGLADTGSQARPGGHAPGDASSGTWVPVAEWLAGPNWGSHFLPRIGAEVLVEFLHGDIDQPRVTGQLYNGEVTLPFAAGIDGATNHPGTLSGVHSQSHDGTGSQQWVVDDAPGQLRQRLQTTLAEGRMELGYLLHHQDHQRGAFRGHGFDLATQAWGNVHASQGLLLSASARAQARSSQMDVAEAVAQLKGAERTAQALHDTAQQQQVPGLVPNERQTALREAIDPQVDGIYSGEVAGQSATKPAEGQRDGGDPVERFERPLLVAEGPDRIAWATPASALAYAGENLHLTSQRDMHLAAGQTFAAVSGGHGAVLAQSGPLRVIAANGPVSLQAHADALEVLADQSVTVTATDNRIDVLAKEKIVLQAGQTRVTLEGGNITFECPGEFTVKASQHPWLGADSGAVTISPLPQGQTVPKGSHPFSV